MLKILLIIVFCVLQQGSVMAAGPTIRRIQEILGTEDYAQIVEKISNMKAAETSKIAAPPVPEVVIPAAPVEPPHHPEDIKKIVDLEAAYSKLISDMEMVKVSSQKDQESLRNIAQERDVAQQKLAAATARNIELEDKIKKILPEIPQTTRPINCDVVLKQERQESSQSLQRIRSISQQILNVFSDDFAQDEGAKALQVFFETQMQDREHTIKTINENVLRLQNLIQENEKIINGKDQQIADLKNALLALKQKILELKTIFSG
jgi:DNA repair exonuclease SbcCD ATPase subunit